MALFDDLSERYWLPAIATAQSYDDKRAQLSKPTNAQSKTTRILVLPAFWQRTDNQNDLRTP
jgi:hypothetical protein